MPELLVVDHEDFLWVVRSQRGNLGYHSGYGELLGYKEKDWDEEYLRWDIRWGCALFPLSFLKVKRVQNVYYTEGNQGKEGLVRGLWGSRQQQNSEHKSWEAVLMTETKGRCTNEEDTDHLTLCVYALSHVWHLSVTIRKFRIYSTDQSSQVVPSYLK